MVLAGD